MKKTIFKSVCLVSSIFWIHISSPGHAQQPKNTSTLTQVDLSLQGNSPANDKRLTSNVTNNLLNRSLFGNTHSSAPLVYTKDSNTWNVLVCTDPAWNRLTYGDYNQWIKAYGKWGKGQNEFRHPMGIAINSGGVLFIADASNNRIAVCRVKFKKSGNSTYTTYIKHIGYRYSGLLYPHDVAWDDNGTIYVGNDKLWVVNTGKDEIRKYRIDTSNNNSLFLEATYGSSGNGVGQFYFPTSIAVGRTNGFNDDNIYVVDRGNHRIVWLEDTPNGIIWQGEYSTASPPVTMYSSVETDWYGGVWVTVENHNQIVKFDRNLGLLDTYGTYGLGQTYGLLNSPKDFAVYYEFKNVNGVKEWFGHPGVFVSESWGGESGAVCYEMGTELKNFSIFPDPANQHLTVSYTLSDYSEVTLSVLNILGQVIKSFVSYEIRPYGENVDVWDGLDNNGNPVAGGIYFIDARIKSLYTGADYITTNSATFSWFLSKHAASAENTPDAYALSPNSPNPFNPETNIHYQLPEANHVRITIYNLLGRQVRVLVDQEKPPGFYRIKWDGHNAIGQQVGTGLYFYVMRSGDFVEKRKMALLR